MKVLNIRSPYFITVDETSQIGSKIELFIWNDGTTEPTVPTYTFSKRISQRTDYNISNFIKEYIENEISYVSSHAANNVKNWCKVKVKRYKEMTIDVYTLLDTSYYMAVNGYTLYTAGYNADNANELEASENVVLQNSSIRTYYHRSNTDYPYIEVLLYSTLGDTLQVEYSNGETEDYVDVIASTDPTGYYAFKIPLTISSSNYDNGNTLKILYNTDLTHTFNVEPIDECKYTPIVCQFINRYGGAQFLTFFKAKTDSIEVKGSSYKLMSPSVNYNTMNPQFKSFNINGNQRVKLNTGWVDENYSDLITDLFLSESIWLDGKPVQVKTQSAILKTYLKDKNINYEIDFEYAFNLINDVV